MPYLTQEEIDTVDSNHKLVYPETIVHEIEAELYVKQLRYFFTLGRGTNDSFRVEGTTIYFDLKAGSFMYPPDVVRVVPGSTIVFVIDIYNHRKIIGVSYPVGATFVD